MVKKIEFETEAWKNGNSYVLTIPSEWVKTGIIRPEIDKLLVSIKITKKGEKNELEL